MTQRLTVPNLTVAGCQGRQARLRESLAALRLDAALIFDRRHVYYLTGYWQRSIYAPALLVLRDGGSVLSVPMEPAEPVAADEAFVYVSNRLGTLVDDQPAAAYEVLRRHISPAQKTGCDLFQPFAADGAPCVDLRPNLLTLRRRKDADELELIRCAISATEAAYAYAYDALQPGMSETDLFAGMLATATEAVGEQLGEMGNDFQIAAPGGPPRRRLAQAGEIAVLDVAVVVRGYTSDLCRSFVVGRKPNDLQQAAHERIMEVHRDIATLLRPGVSARELYEFASMKLEGHRGWRFGHHLGHGIGLAAHEAPRLNPHWSDVLEVGDVFTVEPGLYGDELEAGLRIEENYLLGSDGPERLSQFPNSL